MSSSALFDPADRKPDGPKPVVDRRSRARELAMQALFQLDVQGEMALVDLRSFFIESGEDDMTRQMAEDWALGAWKNHGRLRRDDPEGRDSLGVVAAVER